jgi:hypothetical protein
MKVPPFFRLPPPNAESAPLNAKPVRYPYHDDSDCPVGQEVQRSGQWQYYEPRQIAHTRPRCPICIELNRPRHV